jgi:hypothetical protein
MSEIGKAARKIKSLQETIYVPRHEYRPVDPQAFRHLDLRFYDCIRDALVARGCVWLGDVENVTLKNTANDFRTFIRFFVSDDRVTCVGLFQPKPKFWVRVLLWLLRIKLGKIMDCETELSNGGYLLTSNATEAARLNAPPGFDMKFVPLDTPHETIFETHRGRLDDYLQAHPEVSATRMTTADEVLEMQHRMQTAKANYRKSVGYLSHDELQRMGADSVTAAKLKSAMDGSDRAR